MAAVKSRIESDDRFVQSLLPQQHKLRLALGAGALVSPVTSLAFSPDGSLLAAGGLDNTVKLPIYLQILKTAVVGENQARFPFC